MKKGIVSIFAVIALVLTSCGGGSSEFYVGKFENEKSKDVITFNEDGTCDPDLSEMIEDFEKRIASETDTEQKKEIENQLSEFKKIKMTFEIDKSNTPFIMTTTTEAMGQSMVDISIIEKTDNGFRAGTLGFGEKEAPSSFEAEGVKITEYIKK